jgi:hypothetical protein
MPNGPDLLVDAAAALNGTATGALLNQLMHGSQAPAATPAAAPASPLTATELLSALATFGTISAPPPKAAPQDSGSRTAATPAVLLAMVAAVLAAM